MVSELPYWILALQALSTPAIAFGAVVIGALQWHTAHRKIVFDLFEKRFSVYKDVTSVVGEVARSGVVRHEDLRAFNAATEVVPFLFGDDVKAYFISMQKDLMNMQTYKKMQDLYENDADKFSKYYDKHDEAFKRVTAFLLEGPVLLAPYMLMDQVNPTLELFRRLKKLRSKLFGGNKNTLSTR